MKSYEQLKAAGVHLPNKYDIIADHSIFRFVLVLDMYLPPDNPVFYYDGGPHGILVGDDMPAIVCSYIHRDVREAVAAAKQVNIYITQTAGGLGAEGDVCPPLDFTAPLQLQPGIHELAEQLMKTP